MKVLIIATFLVLTSSAFAANPLAGSWYLPYVQHGNDFNPESLIQFSDDGVMTTARIFPQSSQKVITQSQVEIGASSLKFVKNLQSAKCPDIHDNTPEGALLGFSVSGDTLTLSVNSNPIAQMVRASDAQIRKFANTPEGCN